VIVELKRSNWGFIKYTYKEAFTRATHFFLRFRKLRHGWGFKVQTLVQSIVKSTFPSNGLSNRKRTQIAKNILPRLILFV
jgi:hypothetical protein